MRANPQFFSAKKLKLWGPLLVLASLTLVSIGNPPLVIVRGNAQTVSVSIVDYAFQPSHINITTGTTVTWTYSSGSTYHTVTSQPQTNLTQSGTPLISSGNLYPGQSFSFTFYNPGYYPYECEVHPSLMKGWVMVTGNPVTPPPGTSNSSGFFTLLTAGVAVAAIAVILVAWLFLRRKSSSKQPSGSRSSEKLVL